ncbi:MAG: hypothetical protein ACE5J9_09880 [Methanosarcinales archaeon]
MGIIAILVVNAASPSSSSEDQSVNPQVWRYVYSAKFVCGKTDMTGLAAPVVPGTYATAINVHNPWYFTVNFTKKVAQAPREFDKPIPPSRPIDASLKSDYAFEIDCEDIYKIGNIPPTTKPFAKGFVVITSPRPLDVVAVYTGADLQTNSLQTLEVETLIRPTRVPVPVVTPTPTPK